MDDIQFGQYSVNQLRDIKLSEITPQLPGPGWHKTWIITIPLPVGKYYYKYVVDGEWRYDMRYHSGPDRNGSIVNGIVVTAKLSSLSWASEQLVLRSILKRGDSNDQRIISSSQSQIAISSTQDKSEKSTQDTTACHNTYKPGHSPVHLS